MNQSPPISPRSKGAYTATVVSGAPSPSRNQNVSSIRNCADIEIKSEYSENAINVYLAERGIVRIGDTKYDMCLFQSVMFSEFFEKIENNQLTPSDAEYKNNAAYFYKKALELIHPPPPKEGPPKFEPLENMINKAGNALDELVKIGVIAVISNVDGVAVDLNDSKDNLKTIFNKLKRDLIASADNKDNFTISRDRACFLLFIYTILVDSAKGLMDWCHNMRAPKDRPADVDLKRRALMNILKSLQDATFLKNEKGNLFSGDALSEQEKKLYLNLLRHDDETIQAYLLSAVSQTGSQGLMAILYGIFKNNVLITGSLEPYLVHDGAYLGMHHPTTVHDVGHLINMIVSGIISRNGAAYAKLFEKIFDRILKPGKDSTMTVKERKQDCFVIFYMLHENSGIFDSSSKDKDFLECAQEFYSNIFSAVDAVKLLKNLGFVIPPQDGEESLATCKAVGEAVGSLWPGFVSRHRDLLKNNELRDLFPKFFPKDY